MLLCLEEADGFQFELLDDFADEVEHIVLIIHIAIISPHQCEIDYYVIHLLSQLTVLEIDSDDIAHQCDCLLNLPFYHQYSGREYSALEENS